MSSSGQSKRHLCGRRIATCTGRGVANDKSMGKLFVHCLSASVQQNLLFWGFSACLSPVTMDALFAPLASSLGASVGEVKASHLPKRVAIYRVTRQPLLAHFMSANCISPWKPLHSNTLFPARPQAFIQCPPFAFLFGARPPSAIWCCPTPGQCSRDVLSCCQNQKSEYAMDSICVCRLWTLTSSLY